MATVNKSLKRGFERLEREGKLKELLGELEKLRQRYDLTAIELDKDAATFMRESPTWWNLKAKATSLSVIATDLRDLIDKYTQE